MPAGIEVLLTTEGTYPVSGGGVSTWCDSLIRGARGVRFTLLTVAANPYLTSAYSLPPSVDRWITIPLWGTGNPATIERHPTSRFAPHRGLPGAALIDRELIPLLSSLVDRIWNPAIAGQGSAIPELAALHRLFLRYDFQALLKNERVWNWYTAASRSRCDSTAENSPSIQDLVQSMGWLFRFLSVLTVPIPRVHLVHASAAAFCALPGIVAKALHGTPFLLTEHGVYLREQYNVVGRSGLSPYLMRMLLGLVRLVTACAYAAADVVAPVARFNTRWERQFGVSPDRVEVVYNGVDPFVYQPAPRPRGAPPTVVSVARIDPVKDLITLLKAAAIASKSNPEIRFVVYGGISVPAYHRHLLALRDELGLGERFLFAGHTSDVAGAYASGDVVALSSISEGFPYAVVEAMMCRRPVVATDVGGTREALGEASGILVPPRDPAALAQGILRLLDDKEMAGQMARAGHERAMQFFTIDQFTGRYLDLYQRLSSPLQQCGGRA